MSINLLHQTFLITGIVAAFFTAISFVGTWWTGRIIENAKNEQISSLEIVVKNLQPEVFSQEIVSLNTQENNLFKQEFKVSINSPRFNMIIHTLLSSHANRVGELQNQEVGSGVRQRNNEYVPYTDFVYTFRTDEILNEETDSVIFSTQNDSDLLPINQ